MRLLISLVAAIAFTSAQKGSLATPSSATSLECPSEQLASVVQQQSLLHQPEVFHHAVRIINNLESAPSCHRLAAKDLLHSCQSLEVNDDTQPQGILDAIKSIYAARLAVCELTGAEAAVPPTCLALTPRRQEKYGITCILSRSGCGKKGDTASSIFPVVGQKELRACLGALESRPQWWTSYSNARQNAVLMCNAARTEAEREGLLDSYRAMTGSSEALSGALSESARKANVILESQAAFAESVSKLQATVTSDIAESRSAFHSFVQSVMQQLDDGLQAAMSKFASESSSAAGAMSELEGRIANSDDILSSFQSNLNQVFDSIHDRQDDLAAQHNKQTELASSQALALRDTLSDVRGQQVESIAMSLNGLQTELQSLSQLIALMHANHISLDGRMENFDRTLQSLHNRSATIDDALKHHREKQAALFSDLNTHVEASGGRIIRISESVERLRNCLPSLWSLWMGFVAFIVLIATLVMHVMSGRLGSMPVFVSGATYLTLQWIAHQEIHPMDMLLSLLPSGFWLTSASWTNIANFCAVACIVLVCCCCPAWFLHAYRRSRLRQRIEEEDTTDIEEVEKNHPRLYDLPTSNI